MLLPKTHCFIGGVPDAGNRAVAIYLRYVEQKPIADANVSAS